MSEKRGFFKSLFGRADTAQPKPVPDPQPDMPEAPVAEPSLPDERNEPDRGPIEHPTPPENETPDEAEDIPVEAVDHSEAAPAPAPEIEATPEPDPVPEIEVTPESDPVPAPAPIPSQPPEGKKSWFQRLTSGLSRSSSALGSSITAIFTKRKLDDDTLQELEDILIQADLGVETAIAITEQLADSRYDKEVTDDEVQAILATEVERVLDPVAQPLTLANGKPQVILMVGVNGSGKTTTIGKLAQKLTAQGKSVMLAAGDTFRAAAIEQLKIWGERTGSPVISRDSGADAAGLAFDALNEAIANNIDVLLIDTAGRLQNRTELMAELEKIIRVIKKQMPDAPHHTILTLDATTGQNALQQVEIFGKTAGVSGLVMTKLDGTARGGILVAIAAKHKMPVHYIGVGEGADDLEPFKAADFAAAISGRVAAAPEADGR